MFQFCFYKKQIFQNLKKLLGWQTLICEILLDDISKFRAWRMLSSSESSFAMRYTFLHKYEKLDSIWKNKKLYNTKTRQISTKRRLNDNKYYIPARSVSPPMIRTIIASFLGLRHKWTAKIKMQLTKRAVKPNVKNTWTVMKNATKRNKNYLANNSRERCTF